jgi:saccharopine dehydrogenase-like NADP-dependent oxidoreductase
VNGTIMVVGATGVFGSRLVAQLALCGVKTLVLAGRNPAKAEGLLADLTRQGVTARFVVFDRERPDYAVLKTLGDGVVVDAAGPFQNSTFALAEAAIAAGVNYIDLADARDFVARIPELDQKAKVAGVAVISGASSTPALSHAALAELTKGWRQIDEILVAIAPGNRAPRGRSVIKAILSGVGAPMTLWRESRLTRAHAPWRHAKRRIWIFWSAGFAPGFRRSSRRGWNFGSCNGGLRL